ncbi:PAS domain-containing protein [Sphingomonas sp. PB2P19]|uniref:PAS domain-containing protein n=1 Tax=Sphingomonas rhamnosi TaxID=3096156 RepID=UPI002FCB8E45
MLDASTSCDVDGVIITGELDCRPSRTPDYQSESQALTSLAEAMGSRPDTVLQRLVEVAIELTHCDSAGISLLEPGGEQGTFRWVASAGAWSPYRDGTMPREASPCGEVIARETVLLMNHPERAFPALLQAEPGIHEGLLAPFHIDGTPAGTVWAIKHSPEGQFEAEDARLIKSLARFASAAHQAIEARRAAEASRDVESAGRAQADARLATELSDAKMLQELSGRLIGEYEPQAMYGQVVDVAVALMKSDAASIQIFNPADANLQLVAFRNFHAESAAFWQSVDAASATACGTALHDLQRSIVEDAENSPMMARTQDLEEFRRSGLRSCQSTPLITRAGRLIGMISTQWRDPRMFAETDFALFDILARQAADLIERMQSETKLRESEARFRALATIGSSSVYRMSPDWREMRQLDGSTFLADTHAATADWVDAYIPLDERPRVRVAIDRAIAAKDVFELEHRVLRANGTVGWTFSRAIPFLDDVGEIREWFGAATDVTARVKADQSFTRLFQASPAPFLVLKPDAPHFTIADVNDAYLSATMRTRDEVVGRGIFDAYPDNPSDETIGGVSTLRASLERVLASREPDTLPNLQYDVARPDGTFEQRWWSPVNSAVLDDDGEVEALIHNANDVTEQRRIEIELRESDERQAFLLRLSDALRAERSAGSIANRALVMLFEQMRLDRCYIGIYRPTEGISDVPHQVHDDQLPPLPAQVRLSDSPEGLQALFDPTLVIDEIAKREGLSDSERANLTGLDVGALISASVREADSGPLWAICAVSTRPRVWTPGEVSLVKEVAERTWTAVERARTEVALANSEARFRKMADAAPVLIWETDATGVVFVNANYLDFFGVSVDEVRGMGWAKFLHSEDAAGYLAAYGQGFERREAYVFECRFRRSDGQYRWLRNSGVPVGENHFVGSSTDVTDLLEAQQRVMESEARFRQFSDASTNILWIRNAATMRMEFASPAFDTIYGIAGPERGGDPSLRNWARLIEPQDRKRVLRNFKRIRAGERVEQEFQFRRASDGALGWMHNTDFPLFDGTGKVAWVAGLGADITDAKEAVDRQGVLVAELQHRTRNLIAVVRSLSDRTLGNSGSLEDFGKRFRLRLSALSRVQGLLSHLAAGERVMFDELLRTELAAHGLIDGAANKVTLDGPAGVPLRSGSVQTLALGLHELATNAVKYGAFMAPNGHLTVRWHVEPESGDEPPRLHVEWQESGVEMPLVAVPARGGGYGRELIERALPYQLKAKTTYELGDDGVRCTIAVPISRTASEGVSGGE